MDRTTLVSVARRYMGCGVRPAIVAEDSVLVSREMARRKRPADDDERSAEELQ